MAGSDDLLIFLCIGVVHWYVHVLVQLFIAWEFTFTITGASKVCSFCASKDRVRVSTGSTYICIYLWCTETWKKKYITMTEGAVALSHIYIFTLSIFARWKQQKNIPWFNPQPVSNFVSPYRHNQVLAFCMIILKLDSVASGWLIYSI